MRLTFRQINAFVREWRHWRLTDEDLQALEQLLLQNPEAGDVIAGTGGLRKVRFAAPSRSGGKSGGFRVCYYYVTPFSQVWLLTLFAKSDKANLSAAEKAAWRKFIESLGG